MRAALVLLACALGAGCSKSASESLAGCAAGAYRLDSGELWVLSPSGDDALRYRFMDGRSGRLFEQDGDTLVTGEGWDAREPVLATAGCPQNGTVEWRPASGVPLRGERLALRSSDSTFERDGLHFSARLVLPAGPPRAIVVRGHGSEDYSALVYAWEQYLFPAHEIGVLVYDKRGTGGSSGEYTQDFDVLADDMVAAVAHVRTLAPAGVPIGLIGGSQGGWIAPLAATRTPVAFVVVAYGLAESPLAEDREQVFSELRALGYGADVLAKARLVTDATGEIVASGFEQGFDQLAALDKRFADEPWLEQIEGEFTGSIVNAPDWMVRLTGPMHDVGTPWRHEPIPVLERVEAPMLWVLGGRDSEAPSETTFSILRTLQARPPQLDIVRFPNADHGIIEMRDTSAGPVRTGHSPGYLDVLVGWMAERRLEGQFGSAQLYADRAGAAP